MNVCSIKAIAQAHNFFSQTSKTTNLSLIIVKTFSRYVEYDDESHPWGPLHCMRSVLNCLGDVSSCHEAVNTLGRILQQDYTCGRSSSAKP